MEQFQIVDWSYSAIHGHDENVWPGFGSVFSQLLEYDDVNDTADPTADPFPPYELQDFTWSRLKLSGLSALLCGAAETFTNGSLCLEVRGEAAIVTSASHDLRHCSFRL